MSSFWDANSVAQTTRGAKFRCNGSTRRLKSSFSAVQGTLLLHQGCHGSRGRACPQWQLSWTRRGVSSPGPRNWRRRSSSSLHARRGSSLRAQQGGSHDFLIQGLAWWDRQQLDIALTSLSFRLSFLIRLPQTLTLLSTPVVNGRFSIQKSSAEVHLHESLLQW